MRTLAVPELEQLLDEPCANPKCEQRMHPHNEIYVHARCHPHGGVGVCYKRGTGCLNITCGVCGAPIVDIAVALIVSE